MLSLVVPIYRSEENLPRLFDALTSLAGQLPRPLEVVFVVDGSPDRSSEMLAARLPSWPVRSQHLELSRNFGSFAAIGAGLAAAEGDYVAVLAADLQEPPELVIEFEKILSSGRADVVFGRRERRSDPWLSQALSGTFWAFYRRFVVPEMPKGGIDVFGCTRQVRDALVQMRELNSNLLALLLWLGFRREFVPYQRRARLEGRSAWSFGKKLRYALDSVFNFTDLPIRVLLVVGATATIVSMIASAVVLVRWWMGLIPVLGYTPLMLAVMSFGGVTALGLGIVGQYLWLSLQNTRNRPPYVVRAASRYEPAAPRSDRKSS
ncbi:MAG TPA: glycosyltransferase [Vicinamibacterales bacterium]|nr:glycosyltransferase [Vicinamibacterales bacterium]